jgi:hypothetical protein
MRPFRDALLPPGLSIGHVEVDATNLVAVAQSPVAGCACPECGSMSRRIHIRYERVWRICRRTAGVCASGCKSAGSGASIGPVRGGSTARRPAGHYRRRRRVADRWHLTENASAALLDAVRKSLPSIRRAFGAGNTSRSSSITRMRAMPLLQKRSRSRVDLEGLPR